MTEAKKLRGHYNTRKLKQGRKTLDYSPLLGKPFWTAKRYREMNCKALLALSRHHHHLLPEAWAQNQIMDQNRQASR